MEAEDEADVVYELDAWTSQERLTLAYLLRGGDVPHRWDGDTLMVSTSREAEVDELVAYVEAGAGGRLPTARSVEFAPDDAVAAATSRAVIASPGRRFLGALLDALFVLFPLAAVLAYGDPDGSSWIWWGIVVALESAYVIVGVAVWGQTAGKLLARTRVVSARTGRTPGWGASVARWLVPSLPMLLATRLPFVGAMEIPWAVAVYAGILYHPQRRGIHDRVAGTVVVGY